MKKTNKILVLGGGGYIGVKLCKYLYEKKYNITCLDTFWYGNFLDKNIKVIKDNILSFDLKILKKFDVVINLAYLSNDPSCEIDPKLTWNYGPLACNRIADGCLKFGVKKLIFASSGSIYGLKKEKKVTEELGLDPLTEYNKSKHICEKVLESYEKKLKIAIIRPATVCGFSPRMRFDIVLNIFCKQAFFDKKIKIFGGKQFRPLVHIDDMVRCYYFLIKNFNITGIYNLGFENKSVLQLSKDVQKIIPCKLEIKKSNDIRSYRISSEKIINKGFFPIKNHLHAIEDIKKAFENGFVPTEQNTNLIWLKKKKKL